MRLLVLTSVLCACFVPRAAGQAGDPWLIIATTSTSDDDWMAPAALRVRTELLERGIEVWSPASASRRFEEEASTRAGEITEAELQAWAAQSKAGLWHLVMGEPQAALGELNEAQALTQRAVEALSRSEGGPQNVLDTCLYLFRALTETGFKSEATALVRECRVLVPRGEPSPNMHPAFVSQALEQVDARRAEQPTALRVESRPSGCKVRVNGLMWGETPIEIGDLLPAQYRVQVECSPDRRGRVHVADLATGPAEVFVDFRFERAVEAQPLLHLRYANGVDEREHRVDDTGQIAKAVPSDALLLLSAPAPGVLELELLSGVTLQEKGLARIAMGAHGPSRGDIALAARALVDGKCIDFTKTQATRLPCDVPAEIPSEGGRLVDRRPRGQFIAGLTLAGVGSAALITGYVLLAPRARAGEDWVAQLDSGSPPDGVAQQQWLSVGTAVVVTSSVGAAALVAAMPLALPKRAKTPWWAWLSGGVGVGLAAFSVAYGVTAEATPATSCSNLRITSPDAQTCVRRGEQVSVSILTGVTAAPLLTIPLVYLFRRGDARLTPGVEVSRAGGYVSLRGEF
ncbi:MAG: PEGA domain-containing protein [Myxococcales bacterium]|nr:PEGA domain-containing protein [Myxococcales bacterium]